MSTFSIFLVLSNSLFSIDCSNNGSKPKGGGLSSTIGGSQMLGGVQKTTLF
jgi:preprotein translocase subunit SecG